MINSEKRYKLSEEIQSKIDENLIKYPADYKQSSVLFALTEVQKSNGGWLEDQHLRAIADYLGMTYIAVFEVASFYSMIKLKPRGKHLISICNNISCKLEGADKLVNFLEDYLGIKIGDTTSDGLITLERTECLAACTNAPSMIVDEEYEENLTEEKVRRIIDDIRQGVKSTKNGK
jgi:NADH-quinone oxidoreductase subunit E